MAGEIVLIWSVFASRAGRPAAGPPGNQIGVHSSPAPVAPKGTWGPAGDSVIVGGMQPGFYTLRFRLYQAGVLQDVKYVKFRIGPPPFVIVPELIPLEPLIPFEDPGLSTHELFYRGRTCGPSTIRVRRAGARSRRRERHPGLPSERRGRRRGPAPRRASARVRCEARGDVPSGAESYFGAI